jgi:hypothetical protein
MTTKAMTTKKLYKSWHQGLTPVILATRETEIRRIVIHNWPEKVVQETLS